MSLFTGRNQRLVFKQRDNDLFSGIGCHNCQCLVGNRFGLVTTGKFVAFSYQDYILVLGQENGLAIVFLQVAEKNETGQCALECLRLSDGGGSTLGGGAATGGSGGGLMATAFSFINAISSIKSA